MDLDELAAFRAAAEAGSFSAAARALDVTQPCISRRVQRLEQEVGTALFDRVGTGISVTEAGRRLLQFATETIEVFEALKDTIRTAPWSLNGSVGIVASSTPGQYFLPGLVARFRGRHPQVRVRQRVADSAAVPADLLARTYDLGFSGRLEDDDRLTFEPVGQDEIVLAVPAAHHLARHSAVAVDALAGERLIRREEGSGTQRSFLEALAARGVTLPTHPSPVTAGSAEGVLHAVEAGLGIGLVSVRAFNHHRPARARAVRVAGIPVVRSLYLVYETDRDRLPAVQAFIDLAIACGRGRAFDEELADR